MMNTGSYRKLKTRLFWMIAILAAWEMTAQSGVFPTSIFPSLLVIVRALGDSVVRGEIIIQTGFSLALILQGLLISLLAAIMISSLAISNKVVDGLVDTLVAIAHPLPGIALLPLIIIWFGTGTVSILVIIIHSVIWPLILNMMTGFRSIPPIYKEVGLNLGLNRFRIIKDILIPASLPYALSGLRIGWARAWRALISAEMIFGAVGANGGLGWYIFKQRVFMDTPGLFAGLFVIVLIGIIVEDFFFAVIEERTIKKWGMI
ncbi:ABC-type nitrate/sulfonate/bicarbonate transport system, permease component [Desulfitobacterium dichloroeliminans LMG P-21439]|uniref:ABC-type nitrate/sulfonate/bicarbonate transport system, permease component n=1 Tax=Desulfitobacterium dichloroeliminans (strain LMG P-21439 / DCA1) TaxID=871963 RepID=L0F969_DESDL|nr:ABC transporter permease [Desulfitobacterium dichloroeliminans]AGA70379.1 ABC-type nitrate/sulfonate/bicarbonate transport system, permease component [Desulfitobacterium dichloroeliminans LMG P-21439]